MPAPIISKLMDGLQTTIPNGQRELGPVNLPDSLPAIRIRLARRTSLTPALWPNLSTTIKVVLLISTDGGVSYFEVGSFTANGGILLRSLDSTELSETVYTIQTPLTTVGINRKIKAAVTVQNGPLPTIVTIEAAPEDGI